MLHPATNGLRRWLIPALLLVLGARLDAASSLMAGADEKWRHLQSENFEVYSRNSESESRQLLYNLELMHAVFFETFGFTAVRPVPITVYFFSRDKHFEAYKPEAARKLENIATFYHGDMDRGVLTVAPLPTYEVAQKLAFGGYTYHLFRLMDEQAPVWYTYGISGIFRNLVIMPNSLELGRPDPQQVARLNLARLIPVEVMFGADQKSDAFMSNQNNHLFHDESWALVHYLYFGQHKLPRPSISNFINFVLQNNRHYDAAATRWTFEAQLGLTYEAMNKELDHYFRGGRYGWSKLALPAIPPAKSYALRSVPLEEINTRLAELALRVNRAPLAKLALLQAADRPNAAPRIQETLGSEAIRDGDWDVAIERWERALAAGSTNPALLYELCQIESRRRFQRFDLYYRLPDEGAAKLRDLLQKTIAAIPRLALGYELLAWVEATANEPSIANVNLVQANFARVKEKHRTLLALAVVRMRLNDKAGAAGLLDEIEKAEPSDWVKFGIEHTRARLEDRPVNRDNLPATTSTRRTTPRPPLPVPPELARPPK